MGDRIACDKCTDKTIEELVSNPCSGDKNDILKIMNEKIDTAPIFLALVTNLSYEYRPTTAFFLKTTPSVTGHK